MPPKKPPSTSIPAEKLREAADKAVERKLAEYRRIVKAFLYGLGLLILILVGQKLLSQDSLLKILHDAVFGSKLDEALANSVAVSYNNQFLLGTRADMEPAQSIAFFATPAQKVSLFLRVQHAGAGQRQRVRIYLDHALEQPIRDTDADLSLETDLHIDDSHEHLPSLPRDVHRLTFEIVEQVEDSDDVVFADVLINVKGLETVPP